MRAHEFITESKIKGKDGKACWKGYRYNGTENGKDSCVKVKEDLDEGWKDWVAGAAMGAAALGASGDAEAAKHKPQVQKPAIVQQAKQTVKKPEVKPVAPQASKQEVSSTVSGSPHEAVLKRIAVAAGIKGTELAAFLAQCSHETGDFKHVKEIGGKLDFKKYDPRFAPRKAKTLGNTKAGDGAKYKGRGYIQLTGRDNYKRAGAALGLPLEQKPELVEKPEVAAKVAVWFWKNQVAPKVKNFNDVEAVTKPINPGLKGLDNRQSAFKDYKLSMASR